MRIAIAAVSPAATALRTVWPRIQYVARAQNAAAGTSLICDLNIIRKVGLVATSHAPPSPSESDPSLRPIRNVVQTSAAPETGATRKAAGCPAANLKAAISSGRPGPVIGAMAVSFGTARYPNGVNVASAFGQGAASAIGAGTFRFPCSQRSACDTYE
jgi:hypothetical protein